MAKGDVNGDGQIDIQDAILAAKFALEILTPNEQQRKAAEVVPPCGTIEARDAVRIADREILPGGGRSEDGILQIEVEAVGNVGVSADRQQRERVQQLRDLQW